MSEALLAVIAALWSTECYRQVYEILWGIETPEPYLRDWNF